MYSAVAESEPFKRGIERLEHGAEDYRVVIIVAKRTLLSAIATCQLGAC